MPNPQYRSGDRFEKRVGDDLVLDGYFVWQSRGSKTAVDLIALKPGEVLLIQAKSGITPPRHDEWNQLLAIASYVGAIPLIAERAGRGKIGYRRITGRHAPNKQTWPAVPWSPDEVELAAAITRHPAGKNCDE